MAAGIITQPRQHGLQFQFVLCFRYCLFPDQVHYFMVSAHFQE